MIIFKKYLQKQVLFNRLLNLYYTFKLFILNIDTIFAKKEFIP